MTLLALLAPLLLPMLVPLLSLFTPMVVEEDPDEDEQAYDDEELDGDEDEEEEVVEVGINAGGMLAAAAAVSFNVADCGHGIIIAAILSEMWYFEVMWPSWGRDFEGKSLVYCVCTSFVFNALKIVRLIDCICLFFPVCFIVRYFFSIFCMR
jgi:hypothetical protein